MMLPFLLMFLASGPINVRVVVSDGATGVGIPDARVQWQVSGMKEAGFGHTQRKTTGPNGQVEFVAPLEESAALITVRHEGYVQEALGFYYPLVGGSKGLTKIEIRMWPELSISGLLLDSKSGEPLVGVEVAARRMNLERRQVKWDLETLSAFSDDKGRFRIGMLPPGKYSLTVLPKENARKLSEGLPKEDEVDKILVPFGYPGIAFPESGLINVETAVDLGPIPMRRQPLPSVFGSVAAAGNLEGCQFMPCLRPSGFAQDDPRLTLTHWMPCSGGFRIDNVPSGDYVLETQVRDAGGSGLYSQMVQVSESQPFRYDSRTLVTTVASIARHEANVQLVLNGQPADSFPADLLEDLKMYVIPRAMGASLAPVTNIEKTGRVRVPVLLNTPHTVAISTSPRYVLSGVKYNGSEVKDRQHLFMDSAAAQHTIVLNLSSHPSSITGHIEMRGEKVPVGCLLLTGRSTADDNPSEDRVLEADKEGRVRFERLPAGDYRIVAAPMKVLRTIGDQEVFARLVVAAKHVALGDGEQLRVELGVQ